MLSPEEIRARTFVGALRGYDREEVSAFLEQVAAEVATLQRRLEEAEDAASAAAQAAEQVEVPVEPAEDEPSPPGPFAEIGEQTQRILEAAHAAGEDIRQRAQEDAERELHAARAQAARIVAESERQRDEMAEGLRALEDAREQLAGDLRAVGRTLERMLRELVPAAEATTTVREALAAAARDDESAAAAGAGTGEPAPASPHAARSADAYALEADEPAEADEPGHAVERVQLVPLQGPGEPAEEPEESTEPAKPGVRADRGQVGEGQPAQLGAPAEQPAPAAATQRAPGAEGQGAAEPTPAEPLRRAQAGEPERPEEPAAAVEPTPAQPEREREPAAAEPAPPEPWPAQEPAAAEPAPPEPWPAQEPAAAEPAPAESPPAEPGPAQEPAPAAAPAEQPVAAEPAPAPEPAAQRPAPAPEPVPGPEPEPAPAPAAKVSTPAPHPPPARASAAATVAPPRSERQRGARHGGALAERVPVHARGEALGPSHPKLVRRLKRGLQDIENSTLDRLRRDPDREDVERFLPEKPAIVALGELARGYLEAAYAVGFHAGAAAIGQMAGDAPPPEHDFGGGLATELAEVLTDGLREQLAAGFVEGADLPALAERVDVAFAPLRDGIVAEAGAVALLRAYEWGQHDAWVASGVEGRRWALATEPECGDPRCEDNADGGAVTLGEPFPSGHFVPPARVGCSCTTVPLALRS